MVTCRSLPGINVRRVEDDSSIDPDNNPPRSRLFMVVPKNADGSVIEAEMSRFPGMQYCKTDLIASKGIVFVKYVTSSSACIAMEAIQSTGVVAGYKVKIMLAEPKSKRSDSRGSLIGAQFLSSSGSQNLTNPEQAGLIPGLDAFRSGALGLGHGLTLQGYSGTTIPSVNGNFASLKMGNMLPDDRISQGQSLHGALGINAPLNDDCFVPGLHGLGLQQQSLGSLSADNLLDKHQDISLEPGSIQVSMPKQQTGSSFSNTNAGPEGPPNARLFIVVPRIVTEETLSQLFRCYSGMEYLDLKRDNITGKSKGFAFVGYSTLESAMAARANLDGVEFPFGSGYHIKVRYAESLDASRSRVASSGKVRSASSGAAIGTSSNDTAMTAFQIPSPDSGDSVVQHRGSPQIGQNLHHRFLPSQTTVTQLTSRSDNYGDQTLLSPKSSPLNLNDNSLGVLESSNNDSSIAAMQAGLSNLSLGTCITSNHTTKNEKFIANTSATQSHNSPASADQVSAVQSESGEHTGSWHENSPDLLATATSVNVSGKQGCSSQYSLSPINSSMPSKLDNTIVYSNLIRALPDYTSLTNIFQRCGPVEYVHVLSNEGIAMIKFSSAESAEFAIEKLDGADLFGEILQVRSVPPSLHSSNDGIGAIGSWS